MSYGYTKLKGICKICSTEFLYYRSEQSGLYCSKKCAGKDTVKNLGTRMLGKKWSRSHREKFIKSNSGSKHWGWKGKKISYIALHRWVERHRGKPQKCELCPESGYGYKKYDWASKSRLYKRELDDYIRLCKKCHRKYDHSKKTSEIWRKNIIKYAHPAAKRWHQSPVGLLWHQKQGKEQHNKNGVIL